MQAPSRSTSSSFSTARSAATTGTPTTLPGRTVGDAGAMLRAQRGGAAASAATEASHRIPVFDVTGIYNDDAGYRYQWFHFAQRERMIQMNGNADNHVMWRGNPVPAADAWNAFITWVAAYKADTGRERSGTRSSATSPSGRLLERSLTFIAEKQTLSSSANSVCNSLYPSWTFLATLPAEPWQPTS